MKNKRIVQTCMIMAAVLLFSLVSAAAEVPNIETDSDYSGNVAENITLSAQSDAGYEADGNPANQENDSQEMKIDLAAGANEEVTAGESETAGAEAVEAEGESGDMEGDSQGEEGDSISSGDSSELQPTEMTFQIDDIPEAYLEPAEVQGTVEKVRYEILNEEGTKEVKSVYVYLPAGYEENEDSYNVLYLLHASGGSPKDYLDNNNVTQFQCILDHMIEAGELEPMIVAAPTYFPSDSFVQFMPLGFQVLEISDFPGELTDIIIPVVEDTYRTYAESTDADGITASRDHRAVAGFSLGGTATWNAFIQSMFAFRWFLPISEASWDDGEGGIDGIWDSDLSAEVLYKAVGDQGYTSDDFVLFVATGTDDTAFEIATEQMKSLLEYNDMFITGENTSCSMMIGGTHTKTAIYTYMYHILPALFY